MFMSKNKKRQTEVLNFLEDRVKFCEERCRYETLEEYWKGRLEEAYMAYSMMKRMLE